MHIEKLGIALVHLHQNRVGKIPSIGDNVHPDFLEWSQVFRLFGSNIGLIEPPVLVATKVLCIENVLIVVLPKKISNAPMFVGGHGAVVSLTQCANPHIQHAIEGSEISDLRAIRRNLRIGLFRISEQHYARNQRGGELFLRGKETGKPSATHQYDGRWFQQTHKASKIS